MALFRLPLALRLAWRDLRGGLHGFNIFLACIALGVAAIVGVGSVSHSLSDGLSREGRRILGGDVSFAIIHREMSDQERAFMEQNGRVSTVAVMRVMARKTEGDSTLVELKAVPNVWPLLGSVETVPAQPIQDLLTTRNALPGFVAEAALAAKLDLKLGDKVFIGDAQFEYRAELKSEPDKLSAGVGFGPRVIISLDAFRNTGLIQPGSLVRWLNRVTLPDLRLDLPVSDEQVDQFIAKARATFPDAGWEVRTRTNVSPQFEKNLQRFTQFLTLVGLTALIVGGVGVANAVRSYVDRKRNDLATLKSVGATGAYVFLISLTQVMLVALLGTAIGLAIGAALPFIIAKAFGALIPFPYEPAIYAIELGKGVLYGLLTALVFSIAPLGRAHDISVSALFRDQIAPDRLWPRKRYIAFLTIAALILFGAIIGLSTDRKITSSYVIATVFGFVLLRGVAVLIMALARRAPHFHGTELRLAIGNIHRPGALTPSVVLSLGLGLALLVALTMIDGNIRNQITETLPGKTPSFFFMDIRNSEAAQFDEFMTQRAPDAQIERVPMMRGRVVRLNGQRPDEVKARDDASWVLEGDRGITYSEDLPQGSTLMKGDWWSADYKGPPLVSMEAQVAEGLGLKIGDSVTVNVLGRNITATIANLRGVNWRSLGINFVFVYSPNTFAGAPHTMLATASFPQGGDAQRELGLLREVSKTFPSITSVRVKDALTAIADMMSQLAVAIRGASSVALAASILVLAGALAAGRRSRTHDAVVLKTLGATRGQLLKAILYEYAILGLATAIFGVVAGSAAAWGILTKVMKVEDFVWLWSSAFAATGVALVVTIGLGLAGTWRILGQKPAPYLRDL